MSLLNIVLMGVRKWMLAVVRLSSWVRGRQVTRVTWGQGAV